MIRYFLILLGAVMMLALIRPAFSSTANMNSIAAIVNEEVITTNDLDKQVTFVTRQLNAAGTIQLPPVSVLRKQVLQQMIDIEVQTWIAKQSAIKVSNNAVNQAVANVAKQGGLTVDQLYKKMQGYGLSINDYRKQVKDQLAIHMLVQRDLVPTIDVSDEQVTLYKDSLANQAHMSMQYHLSDILIAIPDSAESGNVQAARKKAQEVLDKINSGAMSFKEAAVTSSDSENALQGGDLDWRKYSELPSAFVTAVVDMKPGDVVGPIRAPNGYHLLQLIESKQDDNAKPLTDEEIHQALFNKKLMTMQQSWLEKLKAQSYIKVF